MLERETRAELEQYEHVPGRPDALVATLSDLGPHLPAA
jgi:hypothetical protein